MAEEPGTDLVPVGTDSRLIAADPFEMKRQVASFLDVSTPERAMQLGKAINDTETGLPDGGDLCVSVIGVTMFTRRISGADEAETRYGIYVALHLLDGTNIVTASDGIIEDMPLLKQAYGKPPWPKGVPVTLCKRKAKVGRRYFLLPGDATKTETPKSKK